MGLPYAASADELARARTFSHTSPHTPELSLRDSSQSLAAPNISSYASSHASAVSWSAVFAGAAAAAALSLILLVLGVGLGLSSVSPWSQSGASATTFGVSTILWLTFTQLVASAMGGYLAGRLRARWTATASDEVYFRDTAHGFLAWAVASLVTAALLTSVIGSIVGGGIQAGASVAGGVASTAMAAGAGVAAGESGATKNETGSGPMAYFVDSLFRRELGAPPGTASGTASGTAPADAASSVPTTEVTRILMNTISTGTLPAADARYVGQMVAQRTGISPPEAEKRVTDTYARMQANLNEAKASAKDAADKARKASAYGALWLFVSLLAGAFVASLSATWGGRMRDA